MLSPTARGLFLPRPLLSHSLVRYGVGLSGGHGRYALKEFDAALPNLKKMRDVVDY
jgi:hypothetical protein